MSSELFVLSDNLLSDLRHPGYLLTASEEASGHEITRVTGVRRHDGNFWAATTANNNTTVHLDALAAVSANALIIDRNSNHAGHDFTLEYSTDDAAWSTAFTSTVPSTEGGTPAATNGCLTSEGVWWKTFTSVSKRYWRLTSSAMGAGITVQIGGLYLGQAWYNMGNVVITPIDDLSVDVDFDVTTSPFGWRGTSTVAKPRAAVLELRPEDATDESNIQTYVFDPMTAGHPAWICWQRTTAPTELVLARLAHPGRVRFARTADWYLRSLELPYIEEQPLAL